LKLAKRQSVLINKVEVDGNSIDDSREDNEEVDEKHHA
jgi:hypothetical protein